MSLNLQMKLKPFVDSRCKQRAAFKPTGLVYSPFVFRIMLNIKITNVQLKSTHTRIISLHLYLSISI